MDKPFLSFVLPIYNVADLLPACIDSILDQGFDDIEIILVNDGSTDNSASVCKRYASQHPQIVVVDKVNGGLADARNTGIPFCNGQYIWFVDSDDYLTSNCLSRIVAQLQDHPNILLFNFREVDNGPDKDIMKWKTADKLYSGAEIVEKYASYGIQAWTQIYKSTLIEEHHLRFTKGALYEDVLFNMPLYSFVTRVKVVSDIYYCYRQRQGSIMSSKVKLQNLLSICSIFKTMRPIYAATSLPQNFLLDRYQYYLGLLLQFYQDATLSKQEKQMLFKRLRQERFTLPLRSEESMYFTFVKRYGIRLMPKLTFETYPLVLRIVAIKGQ